MNFKKQKPWLRLMGVFFVLAILVGFANIGPAFAEDQIVFKLNGGDAVTYTRTDITNDFTSSQQLYSAKNNWPTKKFYVTDGVELSDLVLDYLDGISGNINNVKQITVKATDNLTKTFTKQELLSESRYYYPNIMTDDPSGAQARDTIIALESAESSDFGDLSQSDGLRLIMGQRAITEQNNPWFVKYVGEINLITTTPDQWTVPTASPSPGIVAAGTEVTLNHSTINGVKIYYTTDGSTPTVNSTMYNVSATYYQPELNVPITINQTTTIKAIAIGPGKTNSNVATFTYTVQ
ncbi:MAG: FN3 associated domain-containing protein [Syntrophomonas sp.]